MKQIAVVLSGCGFKDGSEITESVSTLILLSQKNVNFKVFAPNKEIQTLNYLDNSIQENRNLMSEAAKISRGQVEDMKKLSAKNFDGVIFPGGYGVVKNLSHWAESGSRCWVDPEVERVLNEFYNSSSPIGGICIAPALIARVLGKHGITVTIGDDKETALEIKKTGAIHENCGVQDYISDRENKIITTPAYMYEAKPHEVFMGISGLVKELVEMA